MLFTKNHRIQTQIQTQTQTQNDRSRVRAHGALSGGGARASAPSPTLHGRPSRTSMRRPLWSARRPAGTSARATPISRTGLLAATAAATIATGSARPAPGKSTTGAAPPGPSSRCARSSSAVTSARTTPIPRSGRPAAICPTTRRATGSIRTGAAACTTGAAASGGSSRRARRASAASSRRATLTSIRGRPAATTRAAPRATGAT